MNALPQITVSETEHEALGRLAEAFEARSPAVAGQLLNELDRAVVVPDTDMPANVVRMGGSVTFSADGGEPKSVTLVYPAEADIAAGRVSVMTPVGAALLGLHEGQSITWKGADGKPRTLTVIQAGSEAVAGYVPA